MAAKKSPRFEVPEVRSPVRINVSKNVEPNLDTTDESSSSPEAKSEDSVDDDADAAVNLDKSYADLTCRKRTDMEDPILDVSDLNDSISSPKHAKGFDESLAEKLLLDDSVMEIPEQVHDNTITVKVHDKSDMYDNKDDVIVKQDVEVHDDSEAITVDADESNEDADTSLRAMISKITDKIQQLADSENDSQVVDSANESQVVEISSEHDSSKIHGEEYNRSKDRIDIVPDSQLGTSVQTQIVSVEIHSAVLNVENPQENQLRDAGETNQGQVNDNVCGEKNASSSIEQEQNESQDPDEVPGQRDKVSLSPDKGNESEIPEEVSGKTDQLTLTNDEEKKSEVPNQVSGTTDKLKSNEEKDNKFEVPNDVSGKTDELTSSEEKEKKSEVPNDVSGKTDELRSSEEKEKKSEVSNDVSGKTDELRSTEEKEKKSAVPNEISGEKDELRSTEDDVNESKFPEEVSGKTDQLTLTEEKEKESEVPNDVSGKTQEGPFSEEQESHAVRDDAPGKKEQGTLSQGKGIDSEVPHEVSRKAQKCSCSKEEENDCEFPHDVSMETDTCALGQNKDQLSHNVSGETLQLDFNSAFSEGPSSNNSVSGLVGNISDPEEHVVSESHLAFSETSTKSNVGDMDEELKRLIHYPTPETSKDKDKHEVETSPEIAVSKDSCIRSDSVFESSTSEKEKECDLNSTGNKTQSTVAASEMEEDVIVIAEEVTVSSCPPNQDHTYFVPASRDDDEDPTSTAIDLSGLQHKSEMHTERNRKLNKVNKLNYSDDTNFNSTNSNGSFDCVEEAIVENLCGRAKLIEGPYGKHASNEGIIDRLSNEPFTKVMKCKCVRTQTNSNINFEVAKLMKPKMFLAENESMDRNSMIRKPQVLSVGEVVVARQIHDLNEHERDDDLTKSKSKHVGNNITDDLDQDIAGTIYFEDVQASDTMAKINNAWRKDLSQKGSDFISTQGDLRLTAPEMDMIDEHNLQEAIKRSIDDYILQHGKQLNHKGYSKIHNSELKVLQELICLDTTDDDLLTAKLESLNRRLQNVKGDGNCLFHAVADQLSNHPTHPVKMTAAKLRQAVCNHMRKNKEKFEDRMQGYLADYNLTYDEYVGYMSRSGVWGDLVCNYVMSDFLPMPYMVITPDLTWSAKQHLKNNKNPTQYEIVVVYNGNNHYMSSRNKVWDIVSKNKPKRQYTRRKGRVIDAKKWKTISQVKDDFLNSALKELKSEENTRCDLNKTVDLTDSPNIMASGPAKAEVPGDSAVLPNSVTQTTAASSTEKSSIDESTIETPTVEATSKESVGKAKTPAKGIKRHSPNLKASVNKKKKAETIPRRIGLRSSSQSLESPQNISDSSKLENNAKDTKSEQVGKPDEKPSPAVKSTPKPKDPKKRKSSDKDNDDDYSELKLRSGAVIKKPRLILHVKGRKSTLHFKSSITTRKMSQLRQSARKIKKKRSQPVYRKLQIAKNTNKNAQVQTRIKNIVKNLSKKVKAEPKDKQQMDLSFERLASLRNPRTPDDRLNDHVQTKLENIFTELDVKDEPNEDFKVTDFELSAERLASLRKPRTPDVGMDPNTGSTSQTKQNRKSSETPLKANAATCKSSIGGTKAKKSSETPLTGKEPQGRSPTGGSKPTKSGDKTAKVGKKKPKSEDISDLDTSNERVDMSSEPKIKRPKTPAATFPMETNGTSPSEEQQDKSVQQIYKCPICHKLFGSRLHLNKHVNQVHTRRKYICELCKKEFCKKDTLKNHIRVKHEGKRFVCDIGNCKQEFTRCDQLKYHKFQHSNKFRFVCSQCGKGFNHKGQYEGHMNSHNNARPYKCAKCDKTFGFSQQLTRHVKICGKDADVHCTVKGCDEMFTCDEYLKNHLQQYHKHGEPYICQTCGKMYFYYSSFKVHLKTHIA